MIIVNQSKDEIINFDNVMNIVVTNCDEDGFGIFAGVIIGIDDNFRLLGYYKSEDRAKEVLQQIIFKYQEYIQITSRASGVEGVSVLPKKYEMPKE